MTGFGPVDGLLCLLMIAAGAAWGTMLRRHGVAHLALLGTLGVSALPLAVLIALNADTPLPIAVGVLGHLVASTAAVIHDPRPTWRDAPLLRELVRPARARPRH